MKLVYLLMATFISATALADSFNIIQNGKEYLCEQTGAQDPSDSINCIEKAYSGPFSKEEATRLCQGAHSIAPAECGIAAYSGPFSREESIRLCLGARTSSGPVDCANKAYSGPFSREESLTLCSGNSTVSTADCALKAYAGPYSREEAIRICKANPRLIMRTLDLINQSAELKSKVRSMKSQIIEAPAKK